MELAKLIHACPADMVPIHLKRLGWEKTREYAGGMTWMVRKGEHEVMLSFGGKPLDASAFSWRTGDGVHRQF